MENKVDYYWIFDDEYETMPFRIYRRTVNGLDEDSFEIAKAYEESDAIIITNALNSFKDGKST